MFPRGYIPPLVITDPQEVVWEAFFVAVLNLRFDVLDALLERGFPIDYLGPGMSVLNFAVGNGFVPLVEFLVKRGANPELAQRYHSPRANAESHFQGQPNEDRRRILELVGGRELPPEPPGQRSEHIGLAQAAQIAIEWSGEEASRLGQPTVEPHNIFVAMLRDDPTTMLYTLNSAGVNVKQLRATLAPRLVRPENDSIPDFPMSAAAMAVVAAATEDVKSRGGDTITSFHLLDALLRLDNGDIERILNAAGGTAERVRQAFAKYLEGH
jgi:hypothetical protein